MKLTSESLEKINNWISRDDICKKLEAELKVLESKRESVYDDHMRRQRKILVALRLELRKISNRSRSVAMQLGRRRGFLRKYYDVNYRRAEQSDLVNSKRANHETKGNKDDHNSEPGIEAN